MAVFSLLSSCATILDGSRTRIRVHGTPNDAKIYYNGIYKGYGPQKFGVQKSAVRNGNAKIEVRKEGFETETMVLSKKTRVGFIFMDLVLGVFPLFIDIATGNLTAVRPANVEYNLTKKSDKENQVNPLNTKK